MTAEDFDRFAIAMGRLELLLMSKRLDVEVEREFFEVLKLYEIEEVERVIDVLKRGKFFPFPQPVDFISPIEEWREAEASRLATQRHLEAMAQVEAVPMPPEVRESLDRLFAEMRSRKGSFL